MAGCLNNTRQYENPPCIVENGQTCGQNRTILDVFTWCVVGVLRCLDNTHTRIICSWYSCVPKVDISYEHGCKCCYKYCCKQQLLLCWHKCSRIVRYSFQVSCAMAQHLHLSASQVSNIWHIWIFHLFMPAAILSAVCFSCLPSRRTLWRRGIRKSGTPNGRHPSKCFVKASLVSSANHFSVFTVLFHFVLIPPDF